MARGLFGHSLRQASILVVVVALAACGGGSNGSPTSPSTSPAATLPVVLHVRQDLGSFTATLQQRTLSTNGSYRFELAAGSHELTGQLRALGTAGAIWSVLFTTGDVVGVPSGSGGGVAWNSLRSLAGPGPALSTCGAIYSFDGTGTRDFRLQFTVSATRTVGSYCP